MTAFHRRNHGDGYQSCCKVCQIKRVTEYHNTPEGAERRKEYLKKYRSKPEQQALARARQRDYYQRNKERIKKQNRLSMQKAYQDPEKRARKQEANREYQRKKRAAAKAPQ